MSEALVLAPPQTVAAFDAFLAGLRDDTSWELVDGRILAMTDPSLDHEQIAGNISVVLRPALPADRPCRVTTGGVRVQMSDDVRGTYAPRPDVMVYCGAQDGRRNFVTTPLVVVEILSPSNMDSDRGAKPRFYKSSLPTLRHIALVYQDQMRIESYDRTDIGWELVTLTRADDRLVFAARLFDMPLTDVYAGVVLPSG
jgi:Uma2 family endonuclease